MPSESRIFEFDKKRYKCETSIGALVRESEHAKSKMDFVRKLAIAQKEALGMVEQQIKSTMAKNTKIEVKGTAINIYKAEKEDFISLTDIAKHKDAKHTDSIIQNWMRNRNTVELLGFWEQLKNPDFKRIEFEGFRKQALKLWNIQR